MATITSLAKDERAARIAVAAVLEPDDAVTGRLLAVVGAVETVRLAAGTGALPKTVDPVEGEMWRSKVAPRTVSVAAVGRAHEDTGRLGFRVIVPGDNDWPVALNDLRERAPYALWARGTTTFLAASLRDRVTITGMRAATGYGEHVANELATELTDAERIIVSGGSYGIEAAAHRAALAADGHTMAVLPGGLDRLYPAGHLELLERIADRGLLVSELAPGAAPTKWRFLARNRILAALSGASVVVEAGARSGSLTVAARAAQLGRPVGSVPGPVTSVGSAGTHRLLTEGIATIVTNSQDVSRLLEPPAARNHAAAFERPAQISRPPAQQGRSI